MENLMAYVLKLEENKYYVGTTKDLEFRMYQHAKGVEMGGAKWTEKYKPIQIGEVPVPIYTEVADLYTETNLTIKYMNMHGVDNVRGGPWYQVYLPEDKIKFLEQMLDGINFKKNSRCENCQKFLSFGQGHTIKDCEE